MYAMLYKNGHSSYSNEGRIQACAKDRRATRTVIVLTRIPPRHLPSHVSRHNREVELQVSNGFHSALAIYLCYQVQHSHHSEPSQYLLKQPSLHLLYISPRQKNSCQLLNSIKMKLNIAILGLMSLGINAIPTQGAAVAAIDLAGRGEMNMKRHQYGPPPDELAVKVKRHQYGPPPDELAVKVKRHQYGPPPDEIV
ncbi:hypothetical protein GQ44DRAFT_339095 [Phaeosphaeriaceae sp. PMI808]|nr:hypothetical protein GQ44DRAFT_339095 [Phaeosphaeriaceae sp. PMI808]